MALLFAAPAAVSQPPALALRTEGIDHVMLWSGDVDRVTAVFAVKLGFQVRPGSDFGDGVASRYVRFTDQSYLELLYTSRPPAELGKDLRDELDAVGGEPGVRTFAFRVPSVDATDRVLRAGRFDLAPLSPATTDPDDTGPRPPEPADYRIASFRRPALSAGDIFFIAYRVATYAPTERRDRAIARVHPNGARGLVAVWLLAANAALDRDELVRIGFVRGATVRIAALGARGFRLTSGGGTVFVLEPDGPGVAATALKAHGPRMFGASIAVDDLDAAQRRVERGYDRRLTRIAGPLGTGFVAPTYDDIGLWLELVAAPGRR